MRIAIFTDSFLPNKDGVAIVTRTLAKEMAKRKHKITIVCPGKTTGIEKIDGYKIIRLKSHEIKLYRDMKICFKSPEYLEQFKDFSNYDLIHLQSQSTIPLIGFFLAIKHNLPVSSTYHTDLAGFVGSFFKEDIFRNQKNPVYGLLGKNKLILNIMNKFTVKTVWKLEKNLYNAIPSTTVPSRFSRQQLRDHGIKNPVIVLPNPTNPQNSIKDYSKKYDFKNKFIILHVGRLSVEKRVNLLIESVARIKKECPNILTVITSNGPLAKTYKKLVKKLKLTKNIIFTGFIERDELNYLYEKANVVGAFGIFETFNICATEALYYKKPIIISNAGPHNELINNNGYLIEVNNNEINNIANAIKELYNNPKLIKKMSINSKKLWKKYDYKKSLDKHEAFFINAMSQNILTTKNYIEFIKYISSVSIMMNFLLFTLSLKFKKFDKLFNKFNGFFKTISSSSKKLRKDF